MVMLAERSNPIYSRSRLPFGTFDFSDSHPPFAARLRVSVDLLPTQPADEFLDECQRLRAPVEELRACQDGLADLVDTFFTELDARRLELDERAEQLDVFQTTLAQQQQQLAELDAELEVRGASLADEAAHSQAIAEQFAASEARRDQLAAELAESQRQLTELHAELEKAPDAAAQQTALWRAKLEQVESARAAVQTELDAARVQIGQFANMALELAAARAQIGDVRAEMLTLRQQSSVSSEPDEQLRDQLRELELERNAAETELETVRQRNVDLQNRLDEQKRQVIEERAEWNAELRQLRRALERQAESLIQRALAPLPQRDRSEPAVHAAPTRAASKEATAAPDDVMGSVMAQFEQLQRDRQQRRKNGTPKPE